MIYTDDCSSSSLADCERCGVKVASTLCPLCPMFRTAYCSYKSLANTPNTRDRLRRFVICLSRRDEKRCCPFVAVRYRHRLSPLYCISSLYSCRPHGNWVTPSNRCVCYSYPTPRGTCRKVSSYVSQPTIGNRRRIPHDIFILHSG